MNIAIAWYQKDEWEKMKALSVDPDDLDDDYESWKINANTLIATLRESGVIAQKVSVKADRLLQWCQQQGKPLNGEARSGYAAFLLEQRHNRKS